MTDERPFSLLELNALVRTAVRQCMPDTYWVQAETSDVRVASNGHCYLEFIQKDPRSGVLVAKARATIWNRNYQLLKHSFERSTGQIFTSGIKVLVQVAVDMHELYGFSLNVVDIDPTYTLGDLAQRRREILLQLEADGVLTLNKELDMPALPERIAVISSETAAGYEDFCDQLRRNSWGYDFHVELFPAIMQGNRTETSILNALETIMKRHDAFDVVVIIRGGGATSDLTGFDTYLLAAACAQFPLPIITGIGHERDDTVLDMVAHTRVKTPTAAAEYLIDRVGQAIHGFQSLTQRLDLAVQYLLNQEEARLTRLTQHLPISVSRRLTEARYHLQSAQQTLVLTISNQIREQHQKLNYLTVHLKNASPEVLLKRGYSLTLKNGRAVTDPAQVEVGDALVTRVYRGAIRSVVCE